VSAGVSECSAECGRIGEWECKLTKPHILSSPPCACILSARGTGEGKERPMASSARPADNAEKISSNRIKSRLPLIFGHGF